MSEPVILLVEDNESEAELTLRALKKGNILNPVVLARDGAAALDYLFSKGEHEGRPRGNPQIILLDLNLPKIGGLDVLRAIRANDITRRIPVVIMTSSKEERDLNAGYDLGANSYIVKPVNFTEFADAVRQLGLYWLVLNERPPA